MIHITPRGRTWVCEVTTVRLPWERWAIRLRWAWRNALPRVAAALTGMVEMQKFIK